MKKNYVKAILITTFCVLSITQSNSQNIAINSTGTAANLSSMLDISSGSSNNLGLLIPRMTNAQRIGIVTLAAAAQGLVVYQTDGVQGFYYNTSTTTTPSWSYLSSSTAGWSTTGNTSTVAGTNFIGTTDAIDWVIKTNNTERMRVLSAGNVGIGIAAPIARLDIQGPTTRTGVTGTSPSFYVSGTLSTGQTGPASGNVEFRHDNGTQGIGFGYNTIYQTGSNANQELNLLSRGSSPITLNAYPYSTGNVGIGVTNPNYNLEVNGTFGYGNGTSGSYRSRTETRNDAGLIASQSGFYETSAPAPAADWPVGASSWWHLLDIRHSNNANNYALQIAGSFFDQNLYFRKTNGFANTAWNQILTTASFGCATTNYIPKMTSSSTQGCSQLFDNGSNVGVGTGAPVYKLESAGDIYANGGWFRVSGNQGYYFESYGGGWQMVDATWIRAYNSKPILATGGLAGYGNAVFGTPFGGSPRIYANYDNVTGGGVAISDDGGIYDFNDGWLQSRSTNGFQIRTNNTTWVSQCTMYDATGGGSVYDKDFGTGTDFWGYVGSPSVAWYRMYSYGYVTISAREKKRDIHPVEGNLSDLVMADLDKMKPSFYKYKGETDDMEVGKETKFRPNYHLGLILDESPDYLQDETFHGIDVYSAATLGILAGKVNHEEIKEIKEAIGLDKKNKTIQDMGSLSFTGSEKWVDFSADFSAELSGIIPVVTVTSYVEGVSLTITKKTAKGFAVKASDGSGECTFDYIAMAKITTDKSNNEKIKSNNEVLNLKVSDSDKQRIQTFIDQREANDKINEERTKAEANQVQDERKKLIDKKNNSFIDPAIGPIKENTTDTKKTTDTIKEK